VPLRPEDDADSSIVYYPSCTRVKQCGGCCSHKLLTCQPIETQTLTFELIKSQYTGGNKLKYIGKEIALIEEHTKCRCDCAVKEQDCKPFQKYNKPQCKCDCTNVEDQAKCYQVSWGFLLLESEGTKCIQNFGVSNSIN
jgi:PDGF/VEGF domain